MTNLNVAFVVLAVQVLEEPGGLEVLEYLVLAVLDLPHFICFDFTMLHYFIFYSFIFVCLLKFLYTFTLISYSLLIVTAFTLYSTYKPTLHLK